MKEQNEIIAQNLVELRTAKKITQFRLAQELNYSDKAVSKWERAESVPDVSVLKRIADFFGVTVDYLLTEDHSATERRAEQLTAAVRRNRAVVTSLATLLVWLVATVLYVTLRLTIGTSVFPSWLLYIYSIPTSAILLLIFNSIWGRVKLNFLIISLLVWSLLLSVFLSVLLMAGVNIWLIFVIGVPAQAIILVWSRLRTKL